MKDFPDTCLLVDAVSSMAEQIEVDSCGIDFIMASTQKLGDFPLDFQLLVFQINLLKIEIINKATSLIFLLTKNIIPRIKLLTFYSSFVWIAKSFTLD